MQSCDSAYKTAHKDIRIKLTAFEDCDLVVVLLNESGTLAKINDCLENSYFAL